MTQHVSRRTCHLYAAVGLGDKPLNPVLPSLEEPGEEMTVVWSGGVMGGRKGTERDPLPCAFSVGSQRAR